ncbi:MAG: 3-isopropylmalate dehydrogenase [Phenylobacterium sp.]|jgi:3-isopropylmalate dehydrogenase
MAKKIAVIPGDGIGVEVIDEGLKLLQKLQQAQLIDVDYDVFNYNADRWLSEDKGIDAAQVQQLKDDYDAIYFGALGDPRIADSAHARQILLTLRFDLELFANIRPVKLYSRALSPLKLGDDQDIDIVIIRENTEDLYRGIGGSFKTDTVDEIAIDERIHSYKGVKAIIEFAFDYAAKNGRKKVTLVDKDNAIVHGGRLWARVFKEVREKYPDIAHDYMHVDVAAMRMVSEPEGFDVIVTSNMFGDILSDIGAGIVGGLGLLASANVNPDSTSLFEPVHGSAPDIVGSGTANPMAAFVTLSMLLNHIGYVEVAAAIDKVVLDCINQGYTTVDLGGQYSTKQVGDRVTGKTLACFA